MKYLNRKGFTIIELLIATVVFSVILLVITTAIVQFSRIYYKGVIASRTEETARKIIDDVSQTIQFSGDSLKEGSMGIKQYYCIGSTRYSYSINQQLGNGVNHHVLVADNICPDAPYDLTSSAALSGNGATELLGERMQLLIFDVDPGLTAKTYNIKVRVAYGLPDDMIDQNGDGVLDSCKPLKIGGQFCAISELSTSVTQRLK